MHATELRVLIDAQIGGFQRGLAQARAELSGLSREHTKTAGAARLQAIEERNLTRELERQSRALSALTLQYSSARRALLTLGIQTAVTGFAGLTSTISSLVNGLVMLTSTAGGAAGALGVLSGAGLLALGQAAGVAVLGLKGVGKALTTTGQDHEKAMAKLAKPAREFVGQIAEMRDGFREIKLLAQEGLFDGLARAAAKAKPLLEPLKQVTYDTARAMGYLGEQITDLAVNRSNDLKAIGERGVVTLRRFGDAGVNIASAVIDAFRAADPLIGHMTAGIVTFSEKVRAAASDARKDGSLGSFFFELRRDWDEWTSIVGKAGAVIFNVLRAAAPAAHEMDSAIGGVLDHWRQFTGSDAGQRRMREFFEGSLKPLAAMAKFIGAIASAWIDLTSKGNDSATAFFNVLSDHVVPLLHDLGDELNRGFFPAFLKLITSISDYVRALLPGMRPVSDFLHGLLKVASAILDTITGITKSLPKGQKLIVGLALGATVLAGWAKLKLAISLSTLELRRFLGLTRDINVRGPGLRILAGRGGFNAGDEGPVVGGGGGATGGAVAGATGAIAGAVGAAAGVTLVGRRVEVHPVRVQDVLAPQARRVTPLVNEGIVSVGPYRDRATGRFRGPNARVPVEGMATEYEPNPAIFTSSARRGIGEGAAKGLSDAAEKAKPLFKAAAGLAVVSGIIGGLSSESRTISGKLQDAFSAATFGLIPGSGVKRSAAESGLDRVTQSGKLSISSLLKNNVISSNDLVASKLPADLFKKLAPRKGGGAGQTIDLNTKPGVAALQDLITWLNKTDRVSADFAASARDSLDKVNSKLNDIDRDHALGLVQNSLHEAQREFNALAKNGGASLRQIESITQRTTRTIRDRLGEDTAVGRKELAKNFRQAAAAVQAAMDASGKSTKAGTDKIHRYLVDALKGLGLTESQASAKIDNGTLQPTSARVPGQAGDRNGMARGGVVKLPGFTQGDRIPLSINAAPGEDVAIINRHQRKVLDGRLSDMGGLPGLFRNVRTPHHHSAAQGAMFESTAYGPPWGGIEGGGTTATGLKLPGSPTGKPGPYIVAVDPSVIPLHSLLRAWPNPFGYRGNFRAEDTGGAIKGRRLDFLDMIGRAHQNAWGRKLVEVLIGGTGSLGSAASTAAPHIKRVLAGIGGTLGQVVQGSLDADRRAAQSIVDQAAASQAPAGGGSVPMGSGKGAPAGLGMFDGLPVAKWIAPILAWAREHGWGGRVSSGYRNAAQQMVAATNYGLEHYGPGGPLGSNHTKIDWPGGAVDVTDPAQLAQVLTGYHGPRSLVWGGPVIGDEVHFSATGHARGGLISAALGMLAASTGLPPRNDGTPSVDPADAITPGSVKRTKKSSSKAKKKVKPSTAGPGRPSLSKVKGKLKKKQASKGKVPDWMKASATAPDAFDALVNAASNLGTLYDDPISALQDRIQAMAGNFDLTDEQTTVTLEDTFQYADLTNFLATPQGAAYRKFLTTKDPLTDPAGYADDIASSSLEIVNTDGMNVQGKFVRGIAQAVQEFQALLGLHVGLGPNGQPVSDGGATPRSVLGLMLGELGAIDTINGPLYLADRDAAASRVSQFSHIWHMNYEDREAALHQLSKLRQGTSWQQRVADNQARIDTLRSYKDKIAEAAIGHTLTDEAKGNRQWANEQIRKLTSENKQLREDKPAGSILPAKKGESSKERKARQQHNAKIKAKIADLTRDAVQDRVELDYLNGNIHTLDPKQPGGLIGQWRARLDHDNAALADLMQTQGRITGQDLPAERTEIARLFGLVADAQGTTVPYKLAQADTSGSDGLKDTINSLLEQRNDQLARSLAVSESQKLVLDGMAPLLNARFVGAFLHGGLIPETGMALVHQGERITPAPDGPFFNRAADGRDGDTTLELHLHGGLDGLIRHAELRAEQAAMRVVNRTGRKSRVLSTAPGGGR